MDVLMVRHGGGVRNGLAEFLASLSTKDKKQIRKAMG
jgi:hypothetical protein